MIDSNELTQHLAIVTPVLLEWTSNSEYPYGEEIIIDQRIDLSYIAVMILSNNLSKYKVNSALEDEWDGDKKLAAYVNEGKITVGNGNTPTQALFEAEMNYRKYILSIIHRVITENSSTVEDLVFRYIPFRKLTNTEFKQFEASVNFLMKHLDEDWYNFVIG